MNDLVDQILNAPIALVTVHQCKNDKYTEIQMLQNEYDAIQAEIKSSQKKGYNGIV